MKTKLKIPDTLTPKAREFWKRVQEEFRIEDSAGLEVLTQAGRALDRMTEAADKVFHDGMLVVDRWHQQKAHPAVKIEIDCRNSFLSCMRLLGCDGTGELKNG